MTIFRILNKEFIAFASHVTALALFLGCFWVVGKIYLGHSNGMDLLAVMFAMPLYWVLAFVLLRCDLGNWLEPAFFLLLSFYGFFPALAQDLGAQGASIILLTLMLGVVLIICCIFFVAYSWRRQR